MKKVSIKIKLANQAEAIRPLKEANKAFGEPYNQFDRVFLPRSYDKTYGSAEGSPRLVIRTETIDKNPVHLMIFKRPIDKDVQYVFQTQVMDYNQTAHIINNMGYELYAEIPKTRRRLVSGSVKFFLDEIDGYGTFLKLEQTLEVNEQPDVSGLWEIINTLGLNNSVIAPKYSDIIKTERK